MNVQKRPLLTRTWCVCLLAMVCCALWGSAIPCIKIGCRLLGISSADVPSEFLFAGLRFALAGVIALTAASIAEHRPVRIKRGSLGMVVRLSLAQTIVQYAFFYIGVSHASGVKGTIVNASSTFLTILVATLVFRQERMTARKLAGCLIGFAGVVLVNLTGDLGGAMTLTGEGFILVASLSYAVSSSLIRIYSQRENPVALSGYQFVLGGLVLAGAGACMGGRIPHIDPAGVGMLIYLAFVSGIAYSLWSVLLKYNPTSRVAIFGFMNPIFGVILSSILLGEADTLPWQQTAVALVLITAGIVIVNRAPQKERAK
ncbi:DMT family transporter [Collinsella tanakaei]|nr:DMT family transporter [Collinsella tanakaei]